MESPSLLQTTPIQIPLQMQGIWKSQGSRQGDHHDLRCVGLFLAALGLPCCAGFSSSCGERGLWTRCGLPASHWGSFSRWEQKLQGARAQLRHPGFNAPPHAGSSWTWDQTHIPCVGRRTFNPWITREALLSGSDGGCIDMEYSCFPSQYLSPR